MRSHAGGSAEYFSFWFVGRNYGFFGYTQPPMGSPIDIVVDLGTPESFDSWTIQIKLNARG
ncbi:MAG: hypothetical protein LN415_05330 [Candidatus Thermoplasmatota archaeon]|nr:hypothetical protein [Candidatus Thermoplasmatota archaeon]